MDTENFDGLVKLLALKKHEQPPPGYFDRLTRDVMTRIADEQRGRDPLANRLDEETGWLGRLWAMLEGKPALAGAFGVAVCGLMLSVIFYSERLPKPAETVETAGSGLAPSMPSSLELTKGLQAQTNLNPSIDPQLPKGIFDGLYLRDKSLDANFRPPGS